MKRILARSVFIVSLVLLLAAPAMAGDVAMSVAASLKDVVTELTNNFAKSHQGVTFRNNFGGSGALAKQIESGAPADVFLSANTQWMDYLKEKKLVDEKSVAVFAFNELVFVGKPGLKVTVLQDVTKLDKVAIGSPKSVPAGQYATEAFKSAGLEKQLEGKLVMAKDVRECLLYADRGDVEGAFVYKTDAEEMAKNVKILFTVPQSLYPRVTYPAGLTIQGAKNADAVEFLKYLRSDEGKKVLKKHGFIVG